MAYQAAGTYRDKGLSKEDKAAVVDLSRQWRAARDRGDQAGMDAAHQAAEDIRAGYGYSGGADGTEYIAAPKAQKSKPAYQAGGGSGSFSYAQAPAYVSKYQSQIDALTSQILGRAAFSYDAESDPLYQQYRESYTRGGERAMQDTLGQVSARTGGLASSYAGSAAQQTYDGYMSALADKIPELRQLAYEMYQDEGDKQRLNLSMLQALDSGDYGRYQDLLAQYNTDRSFAYGQYRDAVADARYADETAYSRGRDAVSDARYEREFGYQKDRDAVSDARYSREYEDERRDGDYTKALQKARTLAEYGDFSGYQELGYSDGEIARMKASYDAANLLTGAGSTSKGTSGSTPGGGMSWEDVEAWTGRYGEDSAENYIREHYKDLGYSGVSAALAGWENHQTESTEQAETPVQKITSISQCGPAARGILNHVNPTPGYVAEQVERGLKNRTVTEAEADFLLRAVGY